MTTPEAQQKSRGVLDGVCVVEMGMWLAGPVTGGLLADWGADVIKIEPTTGDPMRRLYGTLSGSREEKCPPFDMFNRRKRSLAIDVNTPAGLAVLERVIATADVFLTNMRPAFLSKVGLGADQLTDRYSRLIYASLTGYGLTGPDKDSPGFDVAAFTARSGVGDRMRAPGMAPPSLPGGMGDVITGTTLVAGIAAALFARERTGRGQLVTTSLLRSGIYSIAMDVSARVGLGRSGRVATRETVPNPLMNCYAGSDAWFWLIGADAVKHWPRIVACVGEPALAEDERFATPRDRRRNAAALVAALDTAFAKRTRAEWAQRFAEYDVWWTPLNTVDDLLNDTQVYAAGTFGPDVDPPEPGVAGQPRVIASPVDFGTHPLALESHGPAVGAHTAEVLASLGYSTEEIDSLRASGTVRIAESDSGAPGGE